MATNATVLVTGGAGYLGSILVPELLSAGHRVTVLDSFMYRQNSLAHVCSHSNFDVVNGDTRDEATVKRLIAKGKEPKVALVACMRKLIVILNTMIARGQKWDASLCPAV